MRDYFQINKLSELHDGQNIIFCKTDFLHQEFQYINTLKNDVVLITGNSDYPIDYNRFNARPKNVKRWYAQNALVNHEDLIPIPIGLENKLPSLREGHGIGYFDRVKEKEELLIKNTGILPQKEIYANFNINTNPSYRREVLNVINQTSFIDWSPWDLSLGEFFNKITEYKMIVCPVGNGVDTHRLWEVLYSGRIPITIKPGDYKIYELYEKLPIIILNNLNELRNENLLNYEYEKIIKKDWDKNLLDTNWWKNKILKDGK
jgi:hypothetical protein